MIILTLSPVRTYFAKSGSFYAYYILDEDNINFINIIFLYRIIWTYMNSKRLTLDKGCTYRVLGRKTDPFIIIIRITIYLYIMLTPTTGFAQ
jgi:hypothetical protein